MLELNLLSYQDQLRRKMSDGKQQIWDPIRRKWMISGPEEFVRQLLIQFLIEKCVFPKRLIHVEKKLTINRRQRRFDILLYNRDPEPIMLIECKRPEIEITQDTFDQISRYNIALRVPYLLVTNGKVHYCCSIDYEKKDYTFLSDLPPIIYHGQ